MPRAPLHDLVSARQSRLYAPGVWQLSDIADMVKAVAPKPVNVLMMRPGYTLRQLADLGVRRVSVGSALARVMWGAVINAAKQLAAGRFDVLGTGTKDDLNGIFAK